mmetsp:Transcript_41390/g.103314  ORF Transcript_41390/g.103314 Transcript_41390/m.103314 type:complete len:251 (+) Transcript_41390:237-989(+)
MGVLAGHTDLNDLPAAHKLLRSDLGSGSVRGVVFGPEHVDLPLLLRRGAESCHTISAETLLCGVGRGEDGRRVIALRVWLICPLSLRWWVGQQKAIDRLALCESVVDSLECLEGRTAPGGCVRLFKVALQALLPVVVGVIRTLCEDPLKSGHLRRLWQRLERQSAPAVHRPIGKCALVSLPFRPRVYPLSVECVVVELPLIRRPGLEGISAMQQVALIPLALQELTTLCECSLAVVLLDAVHGAVLPDIH